jgi:opacity protein-like surface antigen
MKKLIFFLCFLVLIQNVKAENLKHKFMLTTKAGNAYLLKNHAPRFTSFGGQIDYFLDDQILLGLDFSYIKYHEPVAIVEIELSGFGNNDRINRKLYNLSFSGKLLLEPGRFSPFFKMGIGLYFPQVIYSQDIYNPWDNLSSSESIYEKTHLGMNMGIGIYYRVWKRWGLQLEGLINHIFTLNEDYSETYPMQYATLNAGLFVIF